MTAEELKQKIKQSVREFGEIRITRGAFGDTSSSVGIVEYIDPTEDGTFTKYFGNKYLYRGYHDLDVNEQLQLGKAFLSRIPRDIFWKSWTIRTYFIFLAIFNRPLFYRRVWDYTWAVKEQLKKINDANPIMRGYKFSLFVKELKRALRVSLEKNGYHLTGVEKGVGLGDVINNLSDFFFLFVEMDTAYGLPLRDLLEIPDKSNSPRKEINRLYKLFLERSGNLDPTHIRKFAYAFKIALAFLYLKSARDIIKDFIKELDCAILERDENDWYYCLDRQYNHRGLSLEVRLLIKEQMDSEAGNVDLWKHYLEQKVGANFQRWILQ